MKFILTALALVLLASLASAGFLHKGWSAPVYRRVVYVSPSYSRGWSGGYGGGGYGGSGWKSGYGGSGWKSGYGGSGWSGGFGGSGWNSGWW